MYMYIYMCVCEYVCVHMYVSMHAQAICKLVWLWSTSGSGLLAQEVHFSICHWNFWLKFLRQQLHGTLFLKKTKY